MCCVGVGNNDKGRGNRQATVDNLMVEIQQILLYIVYRRLAPA